MGLDKALKGAEKALRGLDKAKGLFRSLTCARNGSATCLAAAEASAAAFTNHLSVCVVKCSRRMTALCSVVSSQSDRSNMQ